MQRPALAQARYGSPAHACMEFAMAAEHLILSRQAETVKLEEARRGAYPETKAALLETPKPTG
eukprot:3048593-Pyramimonas_sp.AAC.1